MKGMKKLQFANYRKVYRALYTTFGKSWNVRISYLLALASRACKIVGLPIASSQLIASLAVQDYNRAKTMVFVFVAFSASIGVLAPLTKYVAIAGENGVYTKNILMYFQVLLRRDVKYFNESMTGYITTATRQYSDFTLAIVRKLRDSYLGIMFSMLVPVIVIIYLNWFLGVLVFLLSAIQILYLLWASKKIEPFRTKSREKYKEVSGIISDAITNIIAIKSTAQEDSTSNKLSDSMFQESEIFRKRYKVQVRLIAIREIFMVSFFLTLFWFTVDSMSAGELGVAGAVLVVTYSFTIFSAIYELSDALDEHDDFIDKVLPALEFLEEKNVVFDPKNPLKLGQVSGRISFTNVSFSYHDGDKKLSVFENLNLNIPAGQKLGIVGLSGAGKSTLAKLLLRFEDVVSGKISLDEKDIRNVKQQELRKNIAYVPQEPLLFHSTISANIRLAKLDASDDEVRRAAEFAHATKFIESLPRGFESIVGERGVKLSGGQKQRIAIARAVLQNAPIIVLDEATSALDSESEKIVKDSFATILKGKTAIVIAHRLSTLSDMDRIVLIHEGKILEDGTHEALLKQEGVYAKLWNRQRIRPEDLEVRDSGLEKIS